MLTLETATQYVKDHFAKYDEPQNYEIHSASLTDHDGIPMVKVHFIIYSDSGTHGFTYDVWEETSVNGYPMLYGEW